MLDHSTWEEVEALPSSATYKEKLNAKRRILIQEDEDDDTDLVFWDEHTRPEDIMEGADLEDYYATQRALFKNDTSSTDGEQKKQLQELSRMLGINPKDVDGYHTFFEENQSMDDGASDELSFAFEYCDSLFQSHPELQQDYVRWKHTLDRVSAMDVKRMTNAEFSRLTACPPSILQYVDKEHLPLFQVHRSDFLQQRPALNRANKGAVPPEPSEPVQKGNVQVGGGIHS